MKMDRRQRKTRKAIFNSMLKLLARKQFQQITVQEIIDEADVARSTFYAHFETKDSLLRAICRDIFDHVFSTDLASEPSHDFSQAKQDLSYCLSHLLYHLRDQKGEITAIISSESREVFISFFRDYLNKIFSFYLNWEQIDLPRSFLLSSLSAAFIDLIYWWFQKSCQIAPEQVTAYFLDLYDAKKLGLK